MKAIKKIYIAIVSLFAFLFLSTGCRCSEYCPEFPEGLMRYLPKLKKEDCVGYFRGSENVKFTVIEHYREKGGYPKYDRNESACMCIQRANPAFLRLKSEQSEIFYNIKDYILSDSAEELIMNVAYTNNGDTKGIDFFYDIINKECYIYGSADSSTEKTILDTKNIEIAGTIYTDVVHLFEYNNELQVYYSIEYGIVRFILYGITWDLQSIN